MEEEIWKPIPGFLGYEASTLGRIKSIRNDWRGPKNPDGILKPGESHGGYLFVVLYRDKHRFIRKVHRLILLTFIGPRPAGLETRHHDSNRTNNRLSNLSFCTHAENTLDAIKNGKHPNKKLTTEQVVFIRQTYVKYSTEFGTVALGKRFGVKTETIRGVLTRRTFKYVIP